MPKRMPSTAEFTHVGRQDIPSPTGSSPSWLRRVWNNMGYFAVSPHKFAFGSAFIWHTLAARYFTMAPFQILRSTTLSRPISFVSAEIVQYLGGLNIGYAILALQSLFLAPSDVAGRKRNALVLAIASLSQVWFTGRFYRNGRWSVSGMLPIFIGDAFVSLVTLLYYLQQERHEED